MRRERTNKHTMSGNTRRVRGERTERDSERVREETKPARERAGGER